MRFFGLSEDKLYYDESKKRFVSTKDAPAYIERSFKNGHFKDVSMTCLSLCSNVLTYSAKRKLSFKSSLSLGNN